MTRQDLFVQCSECRKIFNKFKEGSTHHPELCDDCWVKLGQPCIRLTEWAKDENMSEEKTAEIVDRVFEYLKDNLMLNKKGEQLAHKYWEWYIHQENESVLSRGKNAKPRR